MSASNHDEHSAKFQLQLAPAPEANEDEDAGGGASEARTTPNATRRPMKIVELDGVPTCQWRIEPDAVYLRNGRLWRKEPVGCVLCADEEGNDYLTFASTEDRWVTTFVCMQHGELCEVPFAMKKVYRIAIGDVIREGEESLDDTMLFPAEMTLVARNALIEKLLDDAQQEEVAAGPAPSD